MQRRATRRLIAVAAVFVLLFSFAPAVLGAGAVEQAKLYVVAIYLTGTVSVAGVCDEPRVDEQIKGIARQFAGVTNVIVILNGGALFSNAGSIDFPQTGHSVESPFFPYWEVQGGLPIFGYPLTDQFVEGGYRVQYFERQRLEHHPENAAPYNILFGLVGLQTAQQ